MIMMSNVIDLNRKFYITLKAATAVVWKVRERAEEQALTNDLLGESCIYSREIQTEAVQGQKKYLNWEN